MSYKKTYRVELLHNVRIAVIEHRPDQHSIELQRFSVAKAQWETVADPLCEPIVNRLDAMVAALEYGQKFLTAYLEGIDGLPEARSASEMISNLAELQAATMQAVVSPGEAAQLQAALDAHLSH